MQHVAHGGELGGIAEVVCIVMLGDVNDNRNADFEPVEDYSVVVVNSCRPQTFCTTMKFFDLEPPAARVRNKNSKSLKDLLRRRVRIS